MITSDLPIFPELKNLSLEDKNNILPFISKYRPYSDFNFTNLWSWDVLETRKIATLNGNLVVLFTDYRTTVPTLSLLGDNDIVHTTQTIFKNAKDIGAEPVLRFIPEEVAMIMKRLGVHVTEDSSNHDYIFSVSSIANPTDKKLKTKRRLAKQYVESYPNTSLITRDLADPLTHRQILSVLYCWEKNKKLDNKLYEIVYEEIALRRLLGSSTNHNLILNAIYDEETMIAFSIDELLPNNYALSHFIKADITYKGIYEYLNQSVAQQLLTQGVQYWNWEQDLNIEGLRQLKNSYQPTFFLKKYSVTDTTT